MAQGRSRLIDGTLLVFVAVTIALAAVAWWRGGAELLREGLGNPKYAPCPLLRRHVQAGRLGRKSGWGFYTY